MHTAMIVAGAFALIATPPAAAADLVEAWRGAQRNGLDLQAARQAEALSLADKARTAFAQARQETARRTGTVWLDPTTGRGRLAALEKTLASTRLRLDATRLTHEAGDRTTLDLPDAENDAATAELAVLETTISLRLDRLRRAALAGRLDDAVLDTVNATLDERS